MIQNKYNKKRWITPAVCAGLVFIVYGYVSYQISHDSSYVQSQYEDLLTNENTKEQAKILDRLKVSSSDIFDAIEKRFSTGVDTVVVIDELEKYASAQGVSIKIDDIGNKNGTDTDTPARNFMSVTFTISGSEQDLILFFKNISRFPYLISIDTLRLYKSDSDKKVGWIAVANISIPIHQNNALK